MLNTPFESKGKLGLKDECRLQWKRTREPTSPKMNPPSSPGTLKVAESTPLCREKLATEEINPF